MKFSLSFILGLNLQLPESVSVYFVIEYFTLNTSSLLIQFGMGDVFISNVIFALASLISMSGLKTKSFTVWFSSISSHLRQLQHSWAIMLACKCLSVSKLHCEEEAQRVNRKINYNWKEQSASYSSTIFKPWHKWDIHG